MNKRLLSLLTTSLVAATLTGALSGCAGLLLGGAVGTALVVSDRRTSGAQLDDEGIELRASSRLRDAFGERPHINVNSYNRQVLITGEVPTEAIRQQAEQIVGRVDNVRGVINELAVMPNTTLGQRSSDALVTTKVKASYVDAADLQANAIRVTTERGTVYLMGRVTQREADRATQIARTVSGVARVVRVFEIVTDEELRRGVSQTPAPSGTPATPVTSAR